MAGAQDLRDAEHIHLRRRVAGVGGGDDDVAGAGAAIGHQTCAARAAGRIDEVVGALDRGTRAAAAAAEEADIEPNAAGQVGPELVVERRLHLRRRGREVHRRAHQHAAGIAGRRLEHGRLKDHVGIAAAQHPGAHQVEVEHMRVREARAAKRGGRVTQAALEVEIVVRAGLRHEADAVGDRQRGAAGHRGDGMRAGLQVGRVDRERDAVDRIGQ